MADHQTPDTSSSTGTSSSSQSQSVPSSASMDSAGTAATLPTQDAVDGMSDEEELKMSSWGRLFPLGIGFEKIDLEKDVNTFGRGTNNDICFEPRAFKKNPQYQAISTKHFKLYREFDADGTFNVFLTDLSSNGTFINGQKIGKNNTQPLNNNDEISLSLKKHKAYVFQNINQADQEFSLLPEDLKEKYVMSRFLGRGACGEVRLAFSRGSCKKFAVKIISKKTFSVGPRQAALRDEVEILKKLHHPCVIQIGDVFETAEVLYIFLELVEGGELFDRVVSVTRFEEPVAKLLFYQMLVAVKYLHDQGITHRDLKPENVLLSSEKNETLIKITDFGLSKVVGEQSLMKTLCGTPSYLAPEVLLTAGMGGYSKAVDLWSLGVILFICLGGYPPFSEETKKHTLHEQIIKGIYSFPKAYWKSVSPEAIDLIKKLLTTDPQKRITVDGALQHPWISNDEKVIEKANQLMAAVNADMPPPSGPVPKKRHPSDEDDGPSPRRKRISTDIVESDSTTALS
ncbi:serine/threonine-protein kinase Chk2-like [Pocillopora damicornis]|uniref:serine/threonine-protein kinase Chk2-like n=1 Tax=Pocillopora damicornis TaxID=46731 RepID=UPI000F54CE7E|nr:serine/threonine-protein kinase Chk2-like [Pocillopora damicornis]